MKRRIVFSHDVLVRPPLMLVRLRHRHDAPSGDPGGRVSVAAADLAKSAGMLSSSWLPSSGDCMRISCL